MQVIVKHNQSLLDIAIQEDGSVMASFDWALANGLSTTDDLVPGQKLLAPNSIFRNTDVANYFKGRKQNIATGISAADLATINPPLGIGRMRIVSTFIVR